jgi:uncharacterized damage-inducible protein DinB
MSFSNPAGAAGAAAAGYTAALLDLLGDRDPVEVQAETGSALWEATAGLSADDARRPEREGKWSVVAVVRHLVDSEIIYGYRMRLAIAADLPPLPGYDQDAWARRLRYEDEDLSACLDEFEALRRVNLRWLAGLEGGERERAGMHSERGEESVTRIVQLLAAHDLVHLAQIRRIRGTLKI